MIIRRKMNYAAHYEKLFYDTGLELTQGDGCAEANLAKAESRLGVKLPLALRDYYLKSGEHELNQSYHHLIELGEMGFTDDYLIFLDENQSVALWGIPRKNLGEDDPFVWQGENSSPRQWESEGLTVSEFLEMVLYWQAACGGLEFAGSAAGLDADVLSGIERQWSKVRVHNGMQFFVKRGQILVVHEEGGGKFSLLAAGTTLEHFEAIDEALGIDWEWSILDELEE